MKEISWSDFEMVELRSGTITKVEAFPKARKPAYKIWADFGEFGEKKSSAQVTDLYSPEDLIGKQILGVINFPKKQIADFQSEFLLTGFVTEEGVILAVPDRSVLNGCKLS